MLIVFTKDVQLNELVHLQEQAAGTIATSQQQAKVKTSLSKLLAALKASNTLEKVREVHAAAVEAGKNSSIFVATSLISQYGKCGSLVEARRVFEGMRFRSVASWNALMFGYVGVGVNDQALCLFSRMEAEGHTPDGRSFVAALKACAALKRLEQAIAIHLQAASDGCDYSDLFVSSALVDMYAKLGSLVDARKVFERAWYRDVVSWNALILGCAENGEGEVALEMLALMRKEGCRPNPRNYVASLKACTSLAMKEQAQELEGKKLVKLRSLEKGIAAHYEAETSKCKLDGYVGNTLVDMYAKCGSIADARIAFEVLQVRDVVSWNALLSGYVENGECKVALEMFSRMISEGCSPDVVTCTITFKACGIVMALETGRAIHAQVCRLRLDIDALVACAIVDFYSKCGSMAEAQQAFDSLATKDLVTYTALMAGFSREGNHAQVFHLFDRMRDEGLRPDRVTFLCLLSTCNHAGMVDKGKEYFESMPKYGVHREISHYHCMVDILGRANELDAAVTMVKSMPFLPTAVTWTIVLGACEKWKNVQVGRLAFDAMLKLDKNDSMAHLLMANIYRSLGMSSEEQLKLPSSS